MSDLDNNCTDSDEFPLFANYSVVMISSPTCVCRCNKVTYTTVASNSGPLSAENSVLKVDLPNTVCNQEFSVDNGVTWSKWEGPLELGTIEANSHVTMIIRGSVDINAKDNILATAEITSTTIDISEMDNRFNVMTRVVAHRQDCCIPEPDNPPEVIPEPEFECPEEPEENLPEAGNLPRAGSPLQAASGLHENFTAINVRAQIDYLRSNPDGKTEAFSKIPSTINGAGFLNRCWSTDHIQGYIQFYDHRYSKTINNYIFTLSATNRGSIIVKRSDQLDDEPRIFEAPYSRTKDKTAGWDHPSGIAVVGQFLFVPWSRKESKMYIYDIGNNYRETMSFTTVVGCVAVTDCVIGGKPSILMAIASDDNDIYFYRSDITEMCDLRFSYLSTLKIKDIDPQGMGLLQERDTGDVWWVVPHSKGPELGPFTDHVRFYKLGFEPYEYETTRLVSRSDPDWDKAVDCRIPFFPTKRCLYIRQQSHRVKILANSGDTEVKMDQSQSDYGKTCGVHFRFGAGVFVGMDGNIVLLATEKNSNSKKNLATNYLVLRP